MTRRCVYLAGPTSHQPNNRSCDRWLRGGGRGSSTGRNKHSLLALLCLLAPSTVWAADSGTTASTANEHLVLRLEDAGVLRWTTPGGDVWRLMTSPDAQRGFNSGALLDAYAYTDEGGLSGQLFGARRASGPLGTGLPYFSYFAPFTMNQPRAVAPGGVIGNVVEFNSDAQPVAMLTKNPLTVNKSSPVVTINWPNCCKPGGPVSATVNTWVNLAGATAVGGITPSGWLEVIGTVDANDFTVSWTALATSSATGGGSSVTVTPSTQVQTEEIASVATSGAGGFAIQKTELYTANPKFLPLVSSRQQADYAAHWTQVYSPADTSKTHNFATSYGEFNLINRGSDEGYLPNLYSAPRNTIGWWIGPEAAVPAWVHGGGTGHNWNTVFSIFSAGGLVGVYDGLSIQPNALVGAANDPNGHGGVGYDLFGAYEGLPSNPFTTSMGTNTVTVATSRGSGGIISQINGNIVYIPDVYVLNGVTFGGGAYSIANVNADHDTFTISGTGKASANGSGGGSGRWISFANLVPYSPEQYWGEFKHGIVTKNFRSDSGGIIETQPGNGVLWSDGEGTASITGSEVSAGTVDVVLAPAGKGVVKAQGPVALPAYTISTLPSCTSSDKGTMAYVTDALAPSYNDRVTEGGSTAVPVFCNGSVWTAH
jgi:hypothetical protein